MRLTLLVVNIALMKKKQYKSWYQMCVTLTKGRKKVSMRVWVTRPFLFYVLIPDVVSQEHPIKLEQHKDSDFFS